jgi:hypothetical protein
VSRTERSTEAFGGVSQAVVRAISALDETSIDDSLSQARQLELSYLKGRENLE